MNQKPLLWLLGAGTSLVLLLPLGACDDTALPVAPEAAATVAPAPGSASITTVPGSRETVVLLSSQLRLDLLATLRDATVRLAPSLGDWQWGGEVRASLDELASAVETGTAPVPALLRVQRALARYGEAASDREAQGPELEAIGLALQRLEALRSTEGEWRAHVGTTSARRLQ